MRPLLGKFLVGCLGHATYLCFSTRCKHHENANEIITWECDVSYSTRYSTMFLKRSFRAIQVLTDHKFSLWGIQFVSSSWWLKVCLYCCLARYFKSILVLTWDMYTNWMFYQQPYFNWIYCDHIVLKRKGKSLICYWNCITSDACTMHYRLIQNDN